MKHIFQYLTLIVLCLLQCTKATAADENTLTMSDFTAKAGEIVTLSVGLNNTANINNFQFDIVLPEGVSIVADEYGDLLVALSTERTTLARHILSCEPQANGSVRVVCTSMKNYLFNGNSGEVAIITLKLSDDINAGTYSIILNEIELSTPQMVSYNPDPVECTLTVQGYTPSGVYGDVNGDGIVSIADVNEVVRVLLQQK